MSDIDSTLGIAAARGFKLQHLMQFAEGCWQACFIPPNPKGSDAFLYGRGLDAATALREALARHDCDAKIPATWHVSVYEADCGIQQACAIAADDDLFAGL